MRTFFNLLFGYRFHYLVFSKYTDKEGNILIEWSGKATAVRKRSMWGCIAIKKKIGPLHKLPNFPKEILCNGYLVITNIIYIGWFKTK